MEEQQLDEIQTPETPTETAPKAARPASKVLLLGLGVAVGMAVLVVCGSTVYGVYKVSENPFIVRSAALLHLPVASVNGHRILYRDYISDLNSLRTYYKTQQAGANYSAAEQSDQVLSRLIANALVADAAKEMNVSLTDKELEAARKDILSRFGGDETKLAADIEKNLGVSLSEFFDRILTPTLLEKKVAENFATSTDPQFASFSSDQVKARHILFPVTDPSKDAAVKAQAEKVLAEIKKGGDFATLAKKYGTDGTKDAGGDLGWFGKGDMVKEFETAAFALKAGELVKAPVKTSFGYHLIKVDEKRSARNFSTFMNDRLRTATIKVFGDVHNPFADLTANAPAPEAKE